MSLLTEVWPFVLLQRRGRRVGSVGACALPVRTSAARHTHYSPRSPAACGARVYDARVDEYVEKPRRPPIVRPARAGGFGPAVARGRSAPAAARPRRSPRAWPLGALLSCPTARITSPSA